MKKSAVLLILGTFFMFPVSGHVSLTNPKGGEEYHSGDSVNVTWVEVQAHTTLNWNLLFSTDGGLSWDTVKADIPLEALSYQWIVPAIQTVKGKIKIVQNNVNVDYQGISQNFSILSTTGIRNPINLIQMNVYPNPLIDYTSIEFENPLQVNHTLTIYNTQGKMVRSIHNITSDKVRIERKNLTAGLYFIRLRDEHEIRAMGKLLIK